MPRLALLFALQAPCSVSATLGAACTANSMCDTAANEWCGSGGGCSSDCCQAAPCVERLSYDKTCPGGDAVQDAVDAATTCSGLTARGETVCLAETSADCQWTDLNGNDVCLSAGQVEAMQAPEAQAALACSAHTAQGQEACNAAPEAAEDKFNCAWGEVSGYGSCMTQQQIDLLQSPEAQAAMRCSEAKTQGDCGASGECGWCTTSGVTYCTLGTSAQYMDDCEVLTLAAKGNDSENKSSDASDGGFTCRLGAALVALLTTTTVLG